ncbi:hypothetical protein DH2020_006732 [Rehmannia glutinosa]|uniref:TF-B3 domain-containing protein n=1 Tax=Rehmannia glutinosa TaxID=99300 RepID=A0ABR0XKA3_REHGL
MAKQSFGKDNLGSPETRPCFYKIIWLANSIDLRIPPAFKHHLSNSNEEVDQYATLKTPYGKWKVKLEQKKGDIYFVQGWQDFLKHHSLGQQEFLVFKYNGHMSFDVAIYDKNGCEKNYQSIRASRQESASSFTSSFPFFRHVMKATNVGTSSTLFIPKAFQRKHIPLSRHKFVLRNSESICWTVNVTVASTKLLMMCGGWKAFADDNSVKKGDECIFELVEQNTMQVHIFR